MENPNNAISVPPSGMASESAEDLIEAPLFVNDYLPALLAQASELISAEFHLVARKHGFSVTEWRVMATLAGGTPMSIGQLAQVTVTKQPTVTRLLDRMESNGHVKRTPHDSVHPRKITSHVTHDGPIPARAGEPVFVIRVFVHFGAMVLLSKIVKIEARLRKYCS